MILADKIIELRKRNGWSQEELAEKLNVSRQSVSKWEGAQSVPDMNRILMMSEIFGVSTDFLLKDNIEMSSLDAHQDLYTEAEPGARSVSMEEAVDFLAYRGKAAFKVSLGVLMCILSPVALIVVAGLQDMKILNISEPAAAGIGMVVLFALVGGAVALFVSNGLQGNKYEYLEKEAIDTAYGVDGMVKDRRDKYSRTFSICLVSGIVLCVISCIPIFISLWIFGENKLAAIISVAALLVLVAIGVMLIVRAAMIKAGFNMLLQEGEYSIDEKANVKKNETLTSVYWCAATALYLILSFLTGAWGVTWIIWPIAGVSYRLVMEITKMTRK